MQRKVFVDQPDYFLEVLQCARTGDQGRLNNLMQVGYFSLDMLKGTPLGLITPAGFLEFEGESQAVDFLMSNGADVNYIAYGAALGGESNRYRCERLRKQYGADPSFIAKGAAFAFDLDYADELYSKHGANWYEVVLGCVMNGAPQMAIYFIDRHLPSIIFNPDMPDYIRLMSLQDVPEPTAQAFWKYMSTIKLFSGLTGDGRLEAFWHAVGYADQDVDDDVLLLWRFLSPDSDLKPHKANICYGAGLAGRRLHIKSEYLSGSYYKGLIHGNHNTLIPSKLYEPEPNWEYIPIDFKPALRGRNLAFIRNCKVANKANAEMMETIDRWLSFYVGSSHDEHIIKHSYSYGISYKAKIFYLLRGREHNYLDSCYRGHFASFYKLASITHSYLDSFCLQYISRSTFIDMLPNERIATHYMAFDNNDDFKRALLERYYSYNFDHSSNRNSLRINYDFPRAYNNACKVRVLMNKYRFNYDQALVIVTSKELRNFILNTCRDISQYFTKDITASLISSLSGLGLEDSSNLLDKLRYYRLYVEDILKIAHDLEEYANKHITEQSQHASSLAQTLRSTRRHSDALHALSKEQALINRANEGRGAELMHRAPAALQSVVGFFGGIGLHMSRSNAQLAMHEQDYKLPLADDDYEELVSSSLNVLAAKQV